MNTINVSNPTLNNILTILNAGQNTNKSKKRPTFNEVFDKISKRTQNLKSTKQPLNNILTNEQLFRFYIQDTQPLLLKSNDTFNEGNNNLIQSLTSSQPSQNKTYGVADVGNTNEPTNVIASRDYVDNPTQAPPIAFDDMTDEEKLQFVYDNSINILKFFDGLNIEGNNSVETGTLINAILMRDVMTDGWMSFGYDLFNDFYRKGILENVIGELYSIMTRANAENPDTYEQIINTLYNITKVDVEGLSKDELEAEIFRYIQNPPAIYGYRRGTSYQQELAKYQASVSRTPSKIVEGILTDIRRQIQSKSTEVPDEKPTPELKDAGATSIFPPLPERTDEDIFKAQAGQVIRGMIDSLFQDDATANEVDTEPFAGFESFDFMPMRVSELPMRVSDLLIPTANYEALPDQVKPFYKPVDNQPREEAPLKMMTPPSNLNVATDSVVEERRRGGGRPKGSKNKDTIRREAEMRTLILDEVRRDLPPTFADIQGQELEDLINSLFT